jgi:hypothetical protein
MKMKTAKSFLTLLYAPFTISDFFQSFSVTFYYVPKVINTTYFPSQEE